MTDPITSSLQIPAGRDGTAGDLVEHFTWVASRGLLNQATAKALRTACTRVLEIEGEGWQALDVRNLEAESLLNRFETLKKRDYNPGSLATYRSRFKKALQLYLSYLADPSGYRPQMRERASN